VRAAFLPEDSRAIWFLLELGAQCTSVSEEINQVHPYSPLQQQRDQGRTITIWPGSGNVEGIIECSTVGERRGRRSRTTFSTLRRRTDRACRAPWNGGLYPGTPCPVARVNICSVFGTEDETLPRKKTSRTRQCSTIMCFRNAFWRVYVAIGFGNLQGVSSAGFRNGRAPVVLRANPRNSEAPCSLRPTG
jgi:hypothetical protein